MGDSGLCSLALRSGASTELNPACVEEVSAAHGCSPQEASSQQASATLLLGPASQMCLVFSVHGVGIYFPGSCS